MKCGIHPLPKGKGFLPKKVKKYEDLYYGEIFHLQDIKRFLEEQKESICNLQSEIDDIEANIENAATE